MRTKSIATFSIGLILLAACGREYQKSMSESDALDTLTGVSELNSYAAAKGKKKPKTPAQSVSVAELQKLLVQLIAEGKIKVPVPTQVRGATAPSSAADYIAALNAIFSVIPQSNGNLSSFSLALSLMAMFAGNMEQGKFDLTTVLSILQQSLPYVAVIAPQYVPLIQALLIIIPIVMTFMNTMQPAAMLHTMNFNHA
ncbi:MAG: hypothetical protein NT000_08550 [Proteobacteria bacterium]|nr:hypothetical protein [Pseudomonadota bacterium]